MPLPEVGYDHDAVVIEKHIDAAGAVVGAAAPELGAAIHDLSALALGQPECLHPVKSDAVPHRVLVDHAAENRCHPVQCRSGRKPPLGDRERLSGVVALDMSGAPRQSAA